MTGDGVGWLRNRTVAFGYSPIEVCTLDGYERYHLIHRTVAFGYSPIEVKI